MPSHKHLQPNNIHIQHAWEYANSTARLAATGFIQTDLYKIAIQTDDNSTWMLTDYVARTWKKIGGSTVEQTVVGSMAQNATQTITHAADSLGKRFVMVYEQVSGTYKAMSLSSAYEVKIVSATQTSVKKLSTGTATSVKINITI